jgi:hypothetical protein
MKLHLILYHENTVLRSVKCKGSGKLEEDNQVVWGKLKSENDKETMCKGSLASFS